MKIGPKRSLKATLGIVDADILQAGCTSCCQLPAKVLQQSTGVYNSLHHLSCVTKISQAVHRTANNSSKI